MIFTYLQAHMMGWIDKLFGWQKIRELEGEITRWQESAVLTNRMVDAKSQLVSDTMTQNHTLAGKIEQLEDELRTLTQVALTRLDSIGELEEQVSDLEAKLNTANIKIEATEALLEESREKHREIENELARSVGGARDLSDQLTVLKAQYATLEHLHAALTAKYEEATKARDTAVEQSKIQHSRKKKGA